MSEILIARESFITTTKSGTVHVYRGDLGHADHPVVITNPSAFRPLDIKFAVEAPKEKSRKASDEKAAA